MTKQEKVSKKNLLGTNGSGDLAEKQQALIKATTALDSAYQKAINQASRDITKQQGELKKLTTKMKTAKGRAKTLRAEIKIKPGKTRANQLAKQVEMIEALTSRIATLRVDITRIKAEQKRCATAQKRLDVMKKAAEKTGREFDKKMAAVAKPKKRKTVPKKSLKNLIEEIQAFQKSSLKGDYYAPFSINSKNFMEIPEETTEWFDKMFTYFEKCCELSKQKQDREAITGFEILFKLLSDLCDEEIVFADELGPWMMPGDSEKFNLMYVQSASRCLSAEEFSRCMLPVLREDSYSSFYNKVMKKIRKYGSQEQIVAVKSLANKAGVSLK